MKKRKNSCDPSLASPAMTRSRAKADVGAKSKKLGRKSLNQVMQEEARRNLVDGCQRTINDSIKKK